MPGRGRTAWIAILLGLFSLSAYPQDQEAAEPASPPPRKISKAAAEPALRRDMFVSLGVVSQFFPEMTRYAFDPKPSAWGNPVATATANYGSADGSKRIALNVGQYDHASEAILAYERASQKAQATESDTIAIANVGQQVFAGATGRGANADIEMTTVEDTLVVGATLAGYEVTTENISKLADLVRKELAQAQTHEVARRKR